MVDVWDRIDTDWSALQGQVHETSAVDYALNLTAGPQVHRFVPASGKGMS
jgi:hypothetical protein